MKSCWADGSFGLPARRAATAGLVIAAAVSVNCGERENGIGTTNYRAAMIAGLDVVPKDSLCTVMFCSAIVVDPGVLKISRSTNAVMGLDPELHIRPQDFAQIARGMVPIAMVAFQSTSLRGDTVGIKVGVVEPEHEDKLRMMFWIFAPGSIGVAAAVSLSRDRHSWKVDSFDYIEA